MSSKKSPHARSSICESNKKKGNLDINLRDMGKKYAHLTITERRRIEKVGEPEGMRQKQSALTLVTSFCYCFSLCQCVCVCVCFCLPAPVCEGSCQKSTQTSTLKSSKQKATHTNKNGEACWRRGVGHMLKMSKSRQRVVWKACPPATPPGHPLPYCI